VDFFFICHESPRARSFFGNQPKICLWTWVPTYLLWCTYLFLFVCLFVVGICYGSFCGLFHNQVMHTSLSLSLSFSLMSSTYLLTSSLTLWLVGGLPLWEHSSQPSSCFSFECILVENWGFQQTKRLFSIVTNERCLGPTTTKGVC
jgi:hypothetical protein